jgi:hypothetical protein
MHTDKLKSIIAEKNDHLERQALRTAEDIIGQIAGRQTSIAKAEAEIVELRKQLTSLEVEQMDAKSILGSEA